MTMPGGTELSLFIAEFKAYLLDNNNTICTPKFVVTDINFDRLEIHLAMLPDVIKTYNQRQPPNLKIKQVTKVATITEILKQDKSSQQLLSELHTLLRLYLTIPMSNATSERSFSALRRLKTYLRSTMTQERLNHVAFLHVHKNLTDQLELSEVCKGFAYANDRRKSVFGKWKV